MTLPFPNADASGAVSARPLVGLLVVPIGGTISSMLCMVIETFINGTMDAISDRFRQQGRLLPDGVTYKASWIDETRSRCYQAMEPPARALLDQWIAKWNDLVDFEVVPVVTSAEILGATAKQYCANRVMLDRSQVRVTEAYRNFAPPKYVAHTISKLIATVPSKYLVGLDCVVLTNLAGQPRRKRLGKVISRGRRIPQSRVLGYYHRAWNGNPPWIELFIDQILKGGKDYPLWIPLFRELLLGHVLFHELGHHIHVAVRPEYREKEDVADDWGTKLNHNFLKKNHWYLIPIAKIWQLFRKTKRS